MHNHFTNFVGLFFVVCFYSEQQTSTKCSASNRVYGNFHGNHISHKQYLDKWLAVFCWCWTRMRSSSAWRFSVWQTTFTQHTTFALKQQLCISARRRFQISTFSFLRSGILIHTNIPFSDANHLLKHFPNPTYILMNNISREQDN